MPKIGMTLAQKELAEELRSRHGGMVDKGDIMEELGCTSYTTVNKWLIGVPTYLINGKKLYRVSDIARKLDQCRV